jgi:hypothetical protein
MNSEIIDFTEKPLKKTSQSRRWFFIIYNPTQQDIQSLTLSRNGNMLKCVGCYKKLAKEGKVYLFHVSLK